LAKDFADDMALIAQSDEVLRQADFIMFVPLSIIRRGKRGYNQTYFLAKHISKTINKPIIENVLFRKKITKAQFSLSKQEREENIKGSFYAIKSCLILKKKILLIDDIATTCATASACAKELKKAGAKKVFVLTIART
jgi:ComF family protein